LPPTKPTKGRFKGLLGALLPLLLIGCGGGEIYEGKFGSPSHRIECLRVTSEDSILRFLLSKNGSISRLKRSSCPFEIRATAHFVTSCTSPQAKALGSDFDGFLRLELLENGRLLYRNQQDFKGPLTQRVVDTLVERLLTVNRP